MVSMKRAMLVALVVSILALPVTVAQVRSTQENGTTMSDREKHGLRGPVKSCTQENTYAGVTDAEGKNYPESRSERTREYDEDGRTLAIRSRNTDGSEWVTRFTYDPSGRPLKNAYGVEGQAFTETNYTYDSRGTLQKVSSHGKPDISFRHDERGRKIKIEISRPEDYRSNTAMAGSPFEVADRAPNLPGGGSATTIYDERDRPMEVEVRDASGELVNRAVRSYDTQGHVIEETQILDSPETMFPAEVRAKMLEQSGLSADQLRQDLRAQITKLLADQPGPYSISYTYDTKGRINHTSRRVFDHEDKIDTTYNEQGDTESEIARSTRSAGKGDPTYSEVRYSYQYDQYDNWVEQTISYCSSPDGAFQSSTVIKRTLAYY